MLEKILGLYLSDCHRPKAFSETIPFYSQQKNIRIFKMTCIKSYWQVLAPELECLSSKCLFIFPEELLHGIKIPLKYYKVKNKNSNIKVIGCQSVSVTIA